MNYFCNPVNVNYRYQFNDDQRNKGIKVARELYVYLLIWFKGTYYIFASMTLGVWVSEDWPYGKTTACPKVCLSMITRRM